MISVETPSEAMARAIAPLLKEIAATTLRTAEELEPGHYCKVAGEFYRFEGLDSRGRMILWSPHHKDPFFYGPTLGEVFVWHLGAF